VTAGAQSSATSAAVDRWALGVFVGVVVLAVPLLLYLGRDQWFYLDEWWLLGDGPASHKGLFDAHNGHWITVSAIIYRLNYRLWGLHTYLPYQVPVVLLHLGSAVLLRMVIRRLGVRGWIATVTALVFVFFGSGSGNLFFGFQATLTGSLFCALALFLLTDHDGPINRRDWLGLAVGLIGLMTSSVFVLLLVGVGVTVLLRRGTRVAVFYTVPLGIVYGVWYLLNGREESQWPGAVWIGGLELSSSAPGEAVRFAGRMLNGTFTSLGGSDMAGIALGLVVVGTVAAVLVRAARARAWTHLALPAGLLAAWVSFATFTALARAGGLGLVSGASGRYLHISAALFLPLIALGAEYLARRKMLAGALPVLLLAFGLPGIIDALVNRSPYALGNRDQVVRLAHNTYIHDVPPDVQPLSSGIGSLPVTAGWLAREADAGRIPQPTGSNAASELKAFGALLPFRQPKSGGNEAHCPRARRERVRLALVAGDRIVFEGTIYIAAPDGQGGFTQVGFTSDFGSTLVAWRGPLDVVVSDFLRAPRLCEPDPSEFAVDAARPATPR
jgi:hypothetical protein